MGYLLIFSRRGRYRGDPLGLAGLRQPVAVPSALAIASAAPGMTCRPAWVTARREWSAFLASLRRAAWGYPSPEKKRSAAARKYLMNRLTRCGLGLVIIVCCGRCW